MSKVPNTAFHAPVAGVGRWQSEKSAFSARA